MKNTQRIKSTKLIYIGAKTPPLAQQDVHNKTLNYVPTIKIQKMTDDDNQRVENQRIERREFLRKSFGLLAVIGMAFINLKCKAFTDEKKTLIIDLTKCNGCGKCIRKCQHNALSVKNKKAEIDQKLCGGCGDCVKACGRRAILQESTPKASMDTLGVV